MKFMTIFFSACLLFLPHTYNAIKEPDINIWQPPPNTTWQWQLTGEIDTTYDVEMYDIDLFETPIEIIESLHDDDRIVICYFSAGSYEDWRPDADNFHEGIIGHPVDGWQGEWYLDIRDETNLRDIMNRRLDLAVEKGCNGVEPDIIDGYAEDNGFGFSFDDQIAYNIWLAEAAHERGLSIGLKNDDGQVTELVEYFDWALVEQCFAYDYCESFLPFIEADKAVFGVEYPDSPIPRSQYCPLAIEMNYSWLTKEYSLDSSPPNSCFDDAGN